MSINNDKSFDCILDKKEFEKCGCFYKDVKNGKCMSPCVKKLLTIIDSNNRTIKELKSEIDRLSSEINSLRSHLNELKNEV